MNPVERFVAEMQPLLQGGDGAHGAIHRCATAEEAGRDILALAEELSMKRLVVAARRELDAVAAILTEEGSKQGLRIDRDRMPATKGTGLDDTFRDAADYAAFDAGVGGADVLVAESATIGLVAGAHEARALSLLPPVHIVVAPVSRMVERIHDGLARLIPSPPGEHDPGIENAGEGSPTITFITGPSRTADIEKILVLPAHGPSHLYVWLVDRL